MYFAQMLTSLLHDFKLIFSYQFAVLNMLLYEYNFRLLYSSFLKILAPVCFLSSMNGINVFINCYNIQSFYESSFAIFKISP